uniref:Uncharacterized protein n=1 Tax=Nelumbo nucifera TaxID=4432 RepID=A0A822ZTK7_NELNU|nr:TPA_asm: hypothetical protein HUJ06_018144 [Nelumbo nucifera]
MSLLESRSQSSSTTSSPTSAGLRPTKTSWFSSRPPGLSSDIRSTSSAANTEEEEEKRKNMKCNREIE